MYSMPNRSNAPNRNAPRRATSTSKFRSLGLGILLLSSAPFAYADQFYLTAGLDCQPSNSRLVIWFRGLSNDAGERSTKNLGPQSFYSANLVKFSQATDGTYSITPIHEYRECNLGGAKYSIEVMPFLAPKFHPEGYCATRIGIRIVVEKGQEIVIDEGTDACTTSGLVSTKVTVDGKNYIFEKRLATDFLDN